LLKLFQRYRDPWSLTLEMQFLLEIGTTLWGLVDLIRADYGPVLRIERVVGSHAIQSSPPFDTPFVEVFYHLTNGDHIDTGRVVDPDRAYHLIPVECTTMPLVKLAIGPPACAGGNINIRVPAMSD
jgi:hypothetical protein